MRKRKPFDSILFFLTVGLVVAGFLIFMSASLGLLARDGAQFSDIATSQFVLGVLGGLAILYITSHIPYRMWRAYSLYIFIGACIATLLVFVPGLGLELNGARRWINLGITTFQPAELLKIAYVLFLATWLSQRRFKKDSFIKRLFPFTIITGISAVLLLIQPDTGTFLVIGAAGATMYIASGAKLKDIAVLALVATVGLTGLIFSRPYVLDRIETYLNPASDPLGASFQVQQSLIAVGSGKLFGRGYGQSIQKFSLLPEPASDSIFAVFAEEFGFLGGILLVFAFMTFALRGLYIAARTPDVFSGLVAIGITMLIASQSFLNIGAMLGVFPLTGLPLIFVSHGGSALFMALFSVGILLNISRFARV